jgi:peptidoglycan/LPS O-acetylase OafA/YrhL
MCGIRDRDRSMTNSLTIEPPKKEQAGQSQVEVASGLTVQTSAATKFDWIPSIDGLRAVAVLAVLVHHANGAYITNFALGNVGVAIFFSISGFLAYLVLSRDERRLGKVDYNYFLVRRVLRIWPAYLVTILFVCFFAKTAGTTSQQIGLFTFTLNFQMQEHRWPLPGLEALWSISVEEQFYLLAPVMYSLLRSRYAAIFVVVVIVAANAVRATYVATSADMLPNGGLYYATYAYVDTFVIGAVVAKAFTEAEIAGRLLKSIAFTSAVVLFAVVLRLWGTSAFPPYQSYAAIPYALIPFAGGLLLISALPASIGVGKVLSSAVMRWIGKLSYSLYLVHIFVLNKVQALNSPELPQLIVYNAAFFLGVGCLALVLHFAVERPFLALKDHLGVERLGRQAWIPLLIWSAVIAGTGYIATVSQ